MEIRSFRCRQIGFFLDLLSQSQPVPKVPAHSRATKVGGQLENCSEIHSWPALPDILNGSEVSPGQRGRQSLQWGFQCPLLSENQQGAATQQSARTPGRAGRTQVASEDSLNITVSPMSELHPQVRGDCESPVILSCQPHWVHSVRSHPPKACLSPG